MTPNLPLPWLLASIAARTAIVLVCLILGIRLFGKRGMGEMNIYDVLMVLLIGNAVQNALTYGSGNLLVGLVCAAVLIITDRWIGILFVRVPWLERKLSGDPTIIYQDGQFDRHIMHREGVNEEEVAAAARSMGLPNLDKVRLAILEANGTISIIEKEE